MAGKKKKTTSKKCCGKTMSKPIEVSDENRDHVTEAYKCDRCGHRETVHTVDEVKD